MSREKQIEEMANDICNICRPYRHCPERTPCTMANIEAEKLYNAGYRKQSEDVVEVVRCGKCEHWNNGVCYNEAQKYLFTCRSHYCGYGTKMKGGE